VNILPFIVAVLLVLGYGASSLLQKHRISACTEKNYLGLRRAERVLLRKSETAKFWKLPGVTVVKEEMKRKKGENTVVAVPRVNPGCARLNLFPLLTEGKQVHPELYAMALKLLDVFYQDKLFEPKQFLDALLAAAKGELQNKETVVLETLDLGPLQAGYYAALKGTKQCDLVAKSGYPALIDYVKFERVPTQVCLYHAHPNMMAPFFGAKNAPVLYQKLHTEAKPGVEIEAIFHMIDSREIRFVNPNVWKLLELTKPRHNRSAVLEATVADDPASGVSVRRKVFVR